MSGVPLPTGKPSPGEGGAAHFLILLEGGLVQLIKWESTEEVFVLDRPFTVVGMMRDEHGDVTIITLDGLEDPAEPNRKRVKLSLKDTERR